MARYRYIIKNDKKIHLKEVPAPQVGLCFGCYIFENHLTHHGCGCYRSIWVKGVSVSMDKCTKII